MHLQYGLSTASVQDQYRLSTDSVQTQYRLSTDSVQTQCRLSTDSIQTQYRLSRDDVFFRKLKKYLSLNAPHRLFSESWTTDTQWRLKSKISEKLGRCGRQNMLPQYLKIWEWEWIFGRAVKAISPLGVRSPWLQYIQSKVRWRFPKILWPSQNIWTLTCIVILFSRLWGPKICTY